MIKINLLPGYILESRRVKSLLRLLVLVLLVEVIAFIAYLWAPAPFSLAAQNRDAGARLQDATTRATQVQQTEAEVASVKGRYQTAENWVGWVDEADKIPGRWVRFLNLVNKYIPNNVVINGLQPPSGNVLNLTGNTSDTRAAARWYLNMLRCEMVQADPVNAVRFNTATVGWPGQLPTGANPKMQTSVSISVALNADYTRFLTVPGPPADAGAGGGGGGGRLGGGGGMRGGGGGMRGGGGGMGGGGGGMRGGGRGGRGR